MPWAWYKKRTDGETSPGVPGAHGHLELVEVTEDHEGPDEYPVQAKALAARYVDAGTANKMRGVLTVARDDRASGKAWMRTRIDETDLSDEERQSAKDTSKATVIADSAKLKAKDPA